MVTRREEGKKEEKEEKKEKRDKGSEVRKNEEMKE